MEKLSPLEKYKIIQPIIDHEVTALEIEKKVGIPARTLLFWVKNTSHAVIKDLKEKIARIKGIYRCISKDLVDIVRAFCITKTSLVNFRYPSQVSIIAKSQSFQIPSYDAIYNIVKDINPRLVTLAIEG